MQIFAPAKINLRLEVLGRLPKGYHLLRMFNLTVSLRDRLELEWRDQGIEIKVDESSIPADQRNTVFRAISYFQKKFGISFGVGVKMRKRIPAGAGLAGGSSDAAAVLKALMTKFGIPISRLDLEEVAYQIGADVPYLLSGGPAWVEGIGERIEPVSNFPSLSCLLVKPGFASSTWEVYQALGRVSDLTIEPKEVILEAIISGSWKDFCVNHLEKVVFARQRGMERLKSEILRLGALAAVMSGSGSTLVGIFSSSEQAEKGAKEILKFQPELWVEVVKEDQPGAARK